MTYLSSFDVAWLTEQIRGAMESADPGSVIFVKSCLWDVLSKYDGKSWPNELLIQCAKRNGVHLVTGTKQ